MAQPSLLYVTQVAPYKSGPAGVHGVLDQSATAMAQLAETAGLSFRRVADVRALDQAALTAARVVALFTIGETPWSPEQQSALRDGLVAGQISLVSVHSATDACYGWGEYGAMVGARFDGHPWTQTCTLDVVRRDHPAVAHLGATWEWHDEVYQFRDLRHDATVLLAARPGELGAGVDPKASPTRSCGIRCRGASPRAGDGCSPPRSATSPTPGRRRTTSSTWPAGSSG